MHQGNDKKIGKNQNISQLEHRVKHCKVVIIPGYLPGDPDESEQKCGYYYKYPNGKVKDLKKPLLNQII